MTPEMRSDTRFVAVLAALVFCVCFGLLLWVPKQAWTKRPASNGLCIDPHESCTCTMSQGGPWLECKDPPR